MGKQLRLTADLYDQPQKWGQGRDEPTTRRRKGELFEPVSDEERERLVDLQVAEDPDDALKRAEQEIERATADLEAQRAELDAQIEARRSEDPEKLKGAELDAALETRDLSTEGNVREKRNRLSAAIADERAQTGPQQLPPQPEPGPSGS